MTDDAKAVRAVLRDTPQPAHELRRATGLSHERLYTALVWLESMGEALLHSTGRGVAWEAA
jgi:hypothetical protein